MTVRRNHRKDRGKARQGHLHPADLGNVRRGDQADDDGDSKEFNLARWQQPQLRQQMDPVLSLQVVTLPYSGFVQGWESWRFYCGGAGMTPTLSTNVARF